jgi:hypothetical protein
LPRFTFRRWFTIAQLLREPLVKCAEWVPSHGKRSDWSPSVLTPSKVRVLNEGADKCAGIMAEKRVTQSGYKRFVRERSAAEAWSRAALTRLLHNSYLWCDQPVMDAVLVWYNEKKELQWS